MLSRKQMLKELEHAYWMWKSCDSRDHLYRVYFCLYVLGEGLEGTKDNVICPNAKYCGNDLCSHRTWHDCGPGCLEMDTCCEAGSSCVKPYQIIEKAEEVLKNNDIKIDGASVKAMRDMFSVALGELIFERKMEPWDARRHSASIGVIADKLLENPGWISNPHWWHNYMKPENEDPCEELTDDE